MTREALRPVVTTIDALEAASVQYGNRIFIVDGEHEISFKDLERSVKTAAAGLLASGFGAGDHAAVWSPNSANWIIAALAIQYLGGTLVTLNTRYKAAEAAAIIRASRSKVIFSVDRFLGIDYLQQLLNEDCASAALFVALPGNEIKGIDSQDDCERQVALDRRVQPMTDLLETGERHLADDKLAQALAQARGQVTANTPSDILFTSGTTGAPKGVITHHGQNIRAFTIFGDILGLDESDRYLIINPFFHSFGYKAGWLVALLKGATIFPMPLFDVEKVIDMVETHAISVMPGPPTLFQSILQHPGLEPKRLATLKKATTGAAVIPTQLIVDMQTILDIDTVLTAYGLSESSGLVTICRHGDAPEIIATTSGRAIPNVEVAIMAVDGTLLAPEEAGEIVVRGFNVMHGYLDNPEATAEAIDNDGWLHTGDIGILDEQGNLRITDRLKDMYICGGFNCYPAEIENQLLAHPDIAQVAVTGAPDPRMGEVGAAFFVPVAGADPSSEALIAWSREHMANYKAPRYFISMASLPLNASGKVLKTELRKQLDSLIG